VTWVVSFLSYRKDYSVHLWDVFMSVCHFQTNSTIPNYVQKNLAENCKLKSPSICIIMWHPLTQIDNGWEVSCTSSTNMRHDPVDLQMRFATRAWRSYSSTPTVGPMLPSSMVSARHTGQSKSTNKSAHYYSR